MSQTEILEPDRLEGACHPRETPRVVGQDAAVAAFLEAFGQGRLHHAWLLRGPRGVGKATLAWSMARFLLAGGDGGGQASLLSAPAPAGDLEVDPDHPVARRIRALAEPRLFLLRRGVDERRGTARAQITIDEVRPLRDFLSLSAADGGRRVVIVDAADEMNTAAANAILKLLEEPPVDTVLLMVAHRPSALLPTIRSRCRALDCRSLAPPRLLEALALQGLAPADADEAMRLAELAEGSVGAAVELLTGDGLALWNRVAAALSTLPDLDRRLALALAEEAQARGHDRRAAMIVDLVERLLVRIARAGAGHPPRTAAHEGEAELLARLAPNARAARHWAELAARLPARARQALALNLDPGATILDMLLAIAREARAIPA